jgi:exo-beta-1,3-glucanase (GH17 family)
MGRAAKRDRPLTLAGINVANMERDELVETFKRALNDGMHGLCFSAYVEGQEPGDELTDEQIRRRLSIIEPHTSWVRSFACTDGNEKIPVIAKELGMQTLVGAWLGEDLEKNEAEIQQLIDLARAGHVDVAAVGNEVLYREELTEEQLIEYIVRVKAALPDDIPVGYVDAYYQFENRPPLSAACDVILANLYPFWEACHHDYALLYMKDQYNRAARAGNGKQVIVTETGWPSQGASFYAAEPGEINAMKYFIDCQRWSQEDDIEMFYFASFDEAWKVGDEGDVGAYWGLWDSNEQLKYV